MPQAARYKGRRKGTRHMSIARSGLVVPLPATRGGVLATLALAPGYLLAAPSALLAQTAAPSALLAQTAAPSALRRKTSRLRRRVEKRPAFGAPSQNVAPSALLAVQTPCVYRPFRAGRPFARNQGRRARYARTCPWLPSGRAFGAPRANCIRGDDG